MASSLLRKVFARKRSEKTDPPSVGDFKIEVNSFVPDNEIWLVTPGMRAVVNNPHLKKGAEYTIRQPQLTKVVGVGRVTPQPREHSGSQRISPNQALKTEEKQ